MIRDTFTTRDLTAGCFVCHGTDVRWTGPNAQALAAQHHDRTKHQTWCEVHLSIRYGADAGDDRQIDLEDAIAAAPARPQRRLADVLHSAFASSGGRPDAAPLTDPDAPADAPAGVSVPEGRSVETRRHMPRDARGRKPETANV